MQHRRYPNAHFPTDDPQGRNGHAGTFVGRILVMDDGFRGLHRRNTEPCSRQETHARMIGLV